MMVKVKGKRLKGIGYRLSGIGLAVFLSFSSVACAAQYNYQITADVQEQQGNRYVWDFGSVKEGEVVAHNFVLKNDTNSTLIIKDVSTSCGCTVSEIKKKTLSPGEETLIEVKFNSKGYSGAVQQFVYAYTNDLDNPIIRYIIKAEVIK